MDFDQAELAKPQPTERFLDLDFTRVVSTLGGITTVEFLFPDGRARYIDFCDETSPAEPTLKKERVTS